MFFPCKWGFKLAYSVLAGAFLMEGPVGPLQTRVNDQYQAFPLKVLLVLCRPEQTISIKPQPKLCRARVMSGPCQQAGNALPEQVLTFPEKGGSTRGLFSLILLLFLAAFGLRKGLDLSSGNSSQVAFLSLRRQSNP